VRQDVPLGGVAGIRVGANWTVAVILVLIAWLLASSVLPGAVAHLSVVAYWTVGCAAAALFLVSLLAHELSHALVARHNGLKVRAITLWMLGGITELEGEPPDSGADLRIAVVGPATSAVAAGVFLGMAQAVRYAGGPAVVTAGLVWLAEIVAARAGQFLGAGIIGLGLAELLLWAAFGGLWLMLIGWFLVSAADAERRAAAAAAALDGVRVADVMTPDPQVAQGWFTVQDFIERVAARSRQDAFPVVGWGGTLVGVVVTGLLARIPSAQRAELRLDRVALAVPESYLAAPADPAAALLARRPLGGEVLAVVLADGRIAGMVTIGDLRQAVRWRSLAAPKGA